MRAFPRTARDGPITATYEIRQANDEGYIMTAKKKKVKDDLRWNSAQPKRHGAVPAGMA